MHPDNRFINKQSVIVAGIRMDDKSNFWLLNEAVFTCTR